MIVEGNVHNCNSKISTKKVQLNCGQTACLVFDNCKSAQVLQNSLGHQTHPKSFHVQKQNDIKQCASHHYSRALVYDSKLDVSDCNVLHWAT